MTPNERKTAEEENAIGVRLISSSDPSKQRQSFPHFLTAAKLGLAVAQTQVGSMYMDGVGIAKNVAEGIRWMRLAVSQGYPMAECNLGGYYLVGNGVPKDEKKGIQLIKLSDQHGDDYAPYLLGMTAQDPAYAYQCYLRAIGRGNTNAFIEVLKGERNSNLRGASACQETVKIEFAAFFALIKKMVPVNDTYVPQQGFNAVMAEKHSARYVKANRLYALLVLQTGQFSCNISVAWIKVLAACGDVKDAIALGEYMLNTNGQRLIDQAWAMLEFNVNTLKSLSARRDWPGLAERLNGLAGGYSSALSIEDIDLYRERS